MVKVLGELTVMLPLLTVKLPDIVMSWFTIKSSLEPGVPQSQVVVLVVVHVAPKHRLDGRTTIRTTIKN